MPRPRLLLTLAWLACVLCAGLWARSYWRCDVLAWRGEGRAVRVLMSELGGAYLLDDATGGPGYFSVRAGVNGRLEEETGTTRRWWQPFRAWTWGYGGRVAVVPLWVPTLASAASAAWLRRRHVRGHRPPGLCLHCGYDLRASPDRCPECGAVTIARPPAGRR